MQNISEVEVRKLEIEDYQALKSSMLDAYNDMEAHYWRKDQIQQLIELFPEGQFAALVDGKVVGTALTIIVDYQKFGDKHTFRQITGDETFRTHDSEGDVLYGVEVFIHPDYRGLRLGRRLYDARKELCENLNLASIIFGGRIPNYHKYSEQMTPRQYIEKVKHKELFDPVLTFQLANDFNVKRVLRNYAPEDDESASFATLLQWDNIYYTEPNETSHPTVRLGLVQWQMRSYKTMEELFEQVEFFVDAVAAYQSDFVLFPEFFNAPLMAAFNDLSEAQATRELAKFSEEIRERFINLAISYNVNILTGSMPVVKEEGRVYNCGYLCHRSGKVDEYVKIHCTPDEVKYLGLYGGDKVEVFETDCGSVGVLICYDVEFPELGRILAQQDMDILFVPFLTDTQNGYERVRNCAKARAIENECYVAIAGSVGNLPKVHNMDIQFAQSAVFTPCDFAFPTNGIKAEATPNTEMTLIVDVDLDLLSQLHKYGSVRNLKDRRLDLYNVNLKNDTNQNQKPIVKTSLKPT
ncbi:MAG TPA: bifunctional GNAT family N-acetyltransferase/carbon-nitrogen hydrolase family protein [Saprospiraceae bacterium]|nr:bifunctional GNAT family N-acetyltransferase/carbon-nitrogen hydrolase family protein [Saprospiraceae bacterium]